MIILINGAFGVGKTATATVLRERIPGAILFDPEPIGTYARSVTDGIRSDDEDTDDFQDIALWRSLTIATGQHLYRQYGRPLIVPMTLVNRTYLDTVRRGFETVTSVHHFCLTAPLARIQERLIGRGDGPGSWSWNKSERIASLFEDSYFSEHLPTEARSVGAIADFIQGRLFPSNRAS